MKVTLEEFLHAVLKDGKGLVVELKAQRWYKETTVEGELRVDGQMVKKLTKEQALRAIGILERAK